MWPIGSCLIIIDHLRYKPGSQANMQESNPSQQQPNQMAINCEPYFLSGIRMTMPKKLMKVESVHIMFLYFYINGLSILGRQDLLDTQPEPKQEQSQTTSPSTHQSPCLRHKLIEYILSLQFSNGGFACSPLYAGLSGETSSKYEQSHIVFIYSALSSLKVLRALDKVNKPLILSLIKQYQQPDGSFSSFPGSHECDLRFVYSALSICKLFEDLSTIDQCKTKQYIDSCYNYDGGFGIRTNCESHSGAIYCAVASYQHLGLQFEEKRKKRILNFLVNRQSTQVQNSKIVGIQGRVGKLPDSCYSFWVGASIMILTGGNNLLNEHVQNFIMMCYRPAEQSFSKYPTNQVGDPLHTLHSITGLKILQGQTQNICLTQILRT